MRDTCWGRDCKWYASRWHVGVSMATAGHTSDTKACQSHRGSGLSRLCGSKSAHGFPGYAAGVDPAQVHQFIKPGFGARRSRLGEPLTLWKLRVFARSIQDFESLMFDALCFCLPSRPSTHALGERFVGLLGRFPRRRVVGWVDSELLVLRFCPLPHVDKGFLYCCDLVAADAHGFGHSKHVGSA